MAMVIFLSRGHNLYSLTGSRVYHPYWYCPFLMYSECFQQSVELARQDEDATPALHQHRGSSESATSIGAFHSTGTSFTWSLMSASLTIPTPPGASCTAAAIAFPLGKLRARRRSSPTKLA